MSAIKKPLYGLNKKLFVSLLKEYKDNSCLWDATDQHYRNKAVKSRSWNNLLKIFQVEYPTATKYVVIETIAKIRQKYMRLRRKVLEDPSFIPALWYYKYLDFLSSQVKSRKKKTSDSKVEVLEEDEDTKYIKAIENLLKFVPYEQRFLARSFVTQVTNRAKLHQIGLLQLSLKVGANDVIVIPNSEPVYSKISAPSCAITPEDLEREYIEETQSATQSLQMYDPGCSSNPGCSFNEPDYNFIIENEVMEIADDAKAQTSSDTD